MRKLSHDYFPLPDLLGKKSLYSPVGRVVFFLPCEKNVNHVFFPHLRERENNRIFPYFPRENNVFFLFLPWGK